MSNIFANLIKLLLIKSAVNKFSGRNNADGYIGLPDLFQFGNDRRIVLIELNEDIGIAKDQLPIRHACFLNWSTSILRSANNPADWKKS